LALNSNNEFYENSSANLPYSRTFYHNCRIEFSFETACKANFTKANLGKANLREANLKKANQLSIEQLSKVKTLYNAKLDNELLITLIEKHPALFKTQYQNPVMSVKLKITGFCKWLQSL
jgi:uncharacterized protein YjbI with pentapeptide repeats